MYIYIYINIESSHICVHIISIQLFPIKNDLRQPLVCLAWKPILIQFGKSLASILDVHRFCLQLILPT